MSALGTLTVTITFAIAKNMISTWLGGGAPGQVGQDLLDLCKEQLNGWRGNKSEANRIEQVAKGIVLDMTEFWESEASDLPANAKQAIVLSLVETLTNGKLDADTLLQHRLNGDRLAASLAKGADSQTVGLDSTELALYQQLLSKTCRQIIYVANHLNGYVPLMDRFKILTLDQLLENTEKLLAGPAEEAREYEECYRRELPAELDRFDPIGITHAQDLLDVQSLRQAYVNLRLEQTDMPTWEDSQEGIAAHRLTHDSSFELESKQQASIRGPIQQILAASPRIVIRGQPGSGKSTLMRWLAMSIANGELGQDHPALNRWHKSSVPFYLRLRSFDDGLPNPEEWSEETMKMVALPTPSKWMHQLLDEGRGVVLLDGLDEVPLEKRASLLKDVQRLIQRYPTSRFIITSRPAAIKDWPEWNTWSRKAGFMSVTLQDMALDQVFEFVEQWHTALAESNDVLDEKQQITSLAMPLKQELRRTVALRQLARNPLLCSMICALHYRYPKNMPRSRIELYENCIQMLLHSRDRVRGIKGHEDYPPLNSNHMEAILSEYAYHMMLIGEREETSDDMDSYLDNRLDTAVHLPGWAGHSLRDYFIKRTGLILEPAEGKVTFTHTTFQEYLAAKQIINRSEIRLLVNNARDDRWHETITLAASAMVNEKQSKLLFEGLIKKANSYKTASIRHEIYLLAAACLEGAFYLGRELHSDVINHVQALLPPLTQDEAVRIAKAGDPIVGLLRYDERLSVAKMARCVNTLAEIGSAEALNAIIAYAQSPTYAHKNSYSLQSAIGSALLKFDGGDYCTQVLSGISTLDLQNTQVGNEGLAHLANLQGLQTLYLQNTQVGNEGLAHLANLQGLQTLDLQNTQVGNEGLAHLANLQGLQTLYLQNTQVGNEGLAHLANLQGLQTLYLSSTQVGNEGLAHLANLQGLQTLNLFQTQVGNEGLAHLANLQGLQTLYLQNTQVGNEGLAHLANLQGLQTLNLIQTQVGNEGLAHLANLQGLQTLNLIQTQVGNEGLAHLANLQGLQTLYLQNTQVGNEGLAHLANLQGLQTLDLQNTQVGNEGLAHLANLQGLQTLDLQNTQVGNEGLAHLANLQGLQTLYLQNTQVGNEGLAHLANLQGLQTLYLQNTQVGNEGLAHLANLQGLQTLDLQNTQVGNEGLAHLANLQGLQTLYLQNTQVGNEGLAHLANLQGLQTLNLIQTQVGNEGLAHLANLQGLQTLLVSRDRVKNIHTLNHLMKLDIILF